MNETAQWLFAGVVVFWLSLKFEEGAQRRVFWLLLVGGLVLASLFGVGK